MWLVQYALKFRITFYVMSILILLAGIGAYVMMPKDVLPQVNIPVVTVVWTYRNLYTPEMEKRVTTYTEFALSNNVNGIRDMESTTLQGVTITRILFPAGREHRPRAVAGHRVDQLDPRRSAGGHQSRQW